MPVMPVMPIMPVMPVMLLPPAAAGACPLQPQQGHGGADLTLYKILPDSGSEASGCSGMGGRDSPGGPSCEELV